MAPTRGRARTLMIQGTASDAGKSLVVTALARSFARRGVRVAPFKAQNISLNAAVTRAGLEIGRAQAVQAAAAGLEPTEVMNPILLKPEGGSKVQVVVLGRSTGTTTFPAYGERRAEIEAVIVDALDRLRAEYDLVLIEGAGSPAEINASRRDLANLFVAEAAEAPVVLVSDIDRGGVFASIYGTWALLDAPDRARIAGCIINRMRGETSILNPGLEKLEALMHVPVLGVLPFIQDLGIADEDAMSLAGRRSRPRAAPDEVEVAVVDLPHLSNFDDFLLLERTPGVVVRFVRSPRDLAGADLVVLPGSKSTIADLAWLRERGLGPAIAERARAGRMVLGICGGAQMLGEAIEDPGGVESGTPASDAGLGLLPLRTRFEARKRTLQVRARSPALEISSSAAGYEIHMGRTTRTGGRPAFVIVREGDDEADREDGAAEGSVLGTMIHGILEDPRVAEAVLRRAKPEWNPRGDVQETDPFDRVADILEASIDLETLDRIIETGSAPTRPRTSG